MALVESLDSPRHGESPLVNTPPASLWRDLELMTKPRIGLMVVLTSLVGYVLGAEGMIDTGVLIWTLGGVFLTAAASGVLNQALERDSDARMARTAARPLPAGRRSMGWAVALGVGASVLGLALHWWLVNPLTSLLTAFTLISYLLVYTPLKRRTSLNTIVGAVPGAMPPVIGWTAATGGLGYGALALFAILFLWQLPHFLSIAWIYQEDYERGGHRMLPLADRDGRRTAVQMVVHCAALCAVSFLPFAFQMGGWAYLLGAAVVGGLFLAATLAFWRRPSRRSARMVLGASLLYLPGVFGLLAFGL